MARCKRPAKKRGREVSKTGVWGPDFVRFSTSQVYQKAAHCCAICDDGGELAICDGPCMRHFHLNPESHLAAENNCPGVGLPSAHKGPWMCIDCVQKQAKCTQCGKLGSFEGSGDAGPDVRKCPDQFCVRFFCFDCLPAHATACPLHRCKACGEHDEEYWTDIVHCARCPTMWHYDCLKDRQAEGYACDRDIYDHSAHGVDRWIFYCHRHAIDPTLHTPARDHISWL